MPVVMHLHVYLTIVGIDTAREVKTEDGRLVAIGPVHGIPEKLAGLVVLAERCNGCLTAHQTIHDKIHGRGVFRRQILIFSKKIKHFVKKPVFM